MEVERQQGDWTADAMQMKLKRLGGRRIGFCKRLRVDGGEDAEIMREERGYGWVLQGRQRSLAAGLPAIGEEKTDARWV
ncbi:hypothetical protein ACE6H2_028192 [Prunus campanulata]